MHSLNDHFSVKEKDGHHYMKNIFFGRVYITKTVRIYEMRSRFNLSVYAGMI
jgi:hypothetical protein